MSEDEKIVRTLVRAWALACAVASVKYLSGAPIERAKRYERYILTGEVNDERPPRTSEGGTM